VPQSRPERCGMDCGRRGPGEGVGRVGGRWHHDPSREGNAGTAWRAAMKPLAVYVHIPFCTVKCGYCDFNAYAGMDHLKASYADALAAEIHGWKDLLAQRRIATVGFGGGTPGEVPASDIARDLEALAAVSTIDAGAEISLEANPGTTSLSHLRALRAAGVTRISYGAQSFDSAELRFLDRIHSPEAIVASIALAREAAFESVGLDLIYGLPGQALAARGAHLRPAFGL